MSRTYNVVGINLKGMALGESDRLLTILTREQGLIRAVAPGARKPRSQLGGRSGLFVVNQLLIAKGRSLDKITQAETLQSYKGLSQNLGKLAASQYLAELVLAQALSEQPQDEFFLVLNDYLDRLENLQNASTLQILACLIQGIFHLLALGGIAPQVQCCCLSQVPVTPNIHQLQWQVGFSINGGGLVSLSDWYQLRQNTTQSSPADPIDFSADFGIRLDQRLNATQLTILQQLAQPKRLEKLALEQFLNREQSTAFELSDWIKIERLLRKYTEYHLGRTIRSASLIETYTQPSSAKF